MAALAPLLPKSPESGALSAADFWNAKESIRTHYSGNLDLDFVTWAKVPRGAVFLIDTQRIYVAPEFVNVRWS